MIIFWRKIRRRLSHCLYQYGVYQANIEQIRLWVKENYTHRMINDRLKQNFTRGFSERSIRLFRSQHEIHKRSDLEVDSIVEDSIREVCIKMHIHNLCGKVAHSL